MTLRNLYNIFVTHPEGSWIMQPQNAQELYHFIKNNPVKKVLDLGTGIGCTAAVMALAFKDKGETDYEIHTVDQFQKCYDLAQKIIPEELKEHIKFYHVKPTVWQTELIPYQNFSTFEELPITDFDLAMVDGPGPFPEGDKLIDLPNGDIMKLLMEDKIKPGALIAWDGRALAIRSLDRYFGDNFYIVRPAKRGMDDFNIIERKDNPVQFKDYNFENMKINNYSDVVPQ